MTMPKEYNPEYGYKYQILVMNPTYSRAWEALDYARDNQDLTYLMFEYRFAYGAGYKFKAIALPKKYWRLYK